MKKSYMLGILSSIFLISCSSNAVLVNQIVQGRLTNNSQYKGGANPPQEILDELAIYKPSSNQIFHVRNGTNYQPFSANIISFNTDSDGNYTINLPVGVYGVITEEKFEFEQNPYATADCEYIQEPDFILTVVENQTIYVNQFTDKANYCLAYPQ